MTEEPQPTPTVALAPQHGLPPEYTEAQRTELLRQIYLMRTLRIGVRDIAAQFQVSAATVGRWVKEAIDRNLELDNLSIAQMQRLEWDTLDQLQAQLRPAIDAGQIGAIDQARRIAESRRKLMGLDAPDAHDVRLAVRSYVGINMDDV